MLNNTQFKADLLAILSGTTPVPTISDAGNAWGTAYKDYAATGTANGIPPVISPAALTALQASLTAAFSSLPGSPAAVASDIAAALNAFWAVVTFVGALGPPVPSGSAVLSTVLNSIFSVVGGTHDTKSTEIRNAIQTYTGAVIVTFPPANPFPII